MSIDPPPVSIVKLSPLGAAWTTPSVTNSRLGTVNSPGFGSTKIRAAFMIAPAPERDPKTTTDSPLCRLLSESSEKPWPLIFVVGKATTVSIDPLGVSIVKLWWLGALLITPEKTLPDSPKAFASIRVVLKEVIGSAAPDGAVLIARMKNTGNQQLAATPDLARCGVLATLEPKASGGAAEYLNHRIPVVALTCDLHGGGWLACGAFACSTDAATVLFDVTLLAGLRFVSMVMGVPDSLPTSSGGGAGLEAPWHSSEALHGAGGGSKGKPPPSRAS